MKINPFTLSYAKSANASQKVQNNHATRLNFKGADEVTDLQKRIDEAFKENKILKKKIVILENCNQILRKEVDRLKWYERLCHDPNKVRRLNETGLDRY